MNNLRRAFGLVVKTFFFALNFLALTLFCAAVYVAWVDPGSPFHQGITAANVVAAAILIVAYLFVWASVDVFLYAVTGGFLTLWRFNSVVHQAQPSEHARSLGRHV